MNTEKFTKEAFSKDEILSDLLAAEQVKNEHGGEAYLNAIVPCTLLSVLVGILLHSIWGSLALAAVAIFHVIRMIPLAVRSRMARRTLHEAIESGRFTVTVDRLTAIEETEQKHAKTPLRTFRFESGKSWRLVECPEHYKWSEVCNMSSDGLDHTSLVGDEFFTVILDGEDELAYVYNRKLFDYEK